MNKGDTYYYARAFPSVGMFEVLELKIRTIADTWFVGCEKNSKQAFMFNNKDIGAKIFTNRKEALNAVRKVEEQME